MGLREHRVPQSRPASFAGPKCLPLTKHRQGERVRSPTNQARPHQSDPIFAAELLVRTHLHNLVQYLLSQPHFLGCLRGQQLGNLQFQYDEPAGKPPRAHTEMQLPNRGNPGELPPWSTPDLRSWKSASPTASQAAPDTVISAVAAVAALV